MTQQDTLAELDRLIESRSILRHPFYVAWERGELSRKQLATYAATYYPHVAAFPGYLEAALASAHDPVVAEELRDNLADETSNPKPHPELWLDFAAGLGEDRDAVAAAPPRPSTRRTVETFERLARESAMRGLAALYAYESQQPEVAHRKAEGLRTLYGVDDDATVAYFDVHALADVEHRRGARRALARCLETDPAAGPAILDAANQALDAYWGLLDGVCEAVGVRTVA